MKIYSIPPNPKESCTVMPTFVTKCLLKVPSQRGKADAIIPILLIPENQPILFAEEATFVLGYNMKES